MQELIYSFTGIFVAMDIIGILPLYLGMTRLLGDQERTRITRLSVLVAFSVALVFGMTGTWLFRFLGISLADFKVGGGIVLLIMAILDLLPHGKDGNRPQATGVVPLGVPLITGPGTIATAMLQVGLYGHVTVTLALIGNFLFAWFALRYSTLITRVIGNEGADIVSKIAALLMTAIAFAMIRTGLIEGFR
jgi:multiple antibiotic resistance protein